MTERKVIGPMLASVFICAGEPDGFFVQVRSQDRLLSRNYEMVEADLFDGPDRYTETTTFWGAPEWVWVESLSDIADHFASGPAIEPDIPALAE